MNWAGQAGPLGEAVRVAFPWLAALALAMARPMGIALVLPVFTRAQLGGPVSAGFALAMALPVVAGMRDALQRGGVVDALRLGVLGFKEILAGVLLGVLFGLPIWAVQSAGELLDQQRGTGSGAANDPGGGQISTGAGLLGLGAVTAFVSAGGLGLLAQGLYGSYAAWPPLELLPAPRPGATDALLALLDAVLRSALSLAGPVLLALLVAELAVLLVARAVPRLNVFDLAATLKNLVFLAVMVLYLEHVLDAAAAEIGGARRAGDAFRSLFQ